MDVNSTPQEISDYKRNWMMKNPHSVRLHIDLHIEGKNWCRHYLQRWQWSMETYTGPYEHTFFFERKKDAENFAKLYPEFTNV